MQEQRETQQQEQRGQEKGRGPEQEQGQGTWVEAFWASFDWRDCVIAICIGMVLATWWSGCPDRPRSAKAVGNQSTSAAGTILSRTDLRASGVSLPMALGVGPEVGAGVIFASSTSPQKTVIPMGTTGRNSGSTQNTHTSCDKPRKKPCGNPQKKPFAALKPFLPTLRKPPKHTKFDCARDLLQWGLLVGGYLSKPLKYIPKHQHKAYTKSVKVWVKWLRALPKRQRRLLNVAAYASEWLSAKSVKRRRLSRFATYINARAYCGLHPLPGGNEPPL